jgi:NAD-dependent SIR2 family protein deacetylase
MHSLGNDTVFFLGAGFSKAAGAPLQSELMGKVLDYNGFQYHNPIDEFKNRLNEFLNDAFSLNEDQKRNFNLEDFYTPIDKCINEGISFRGYPVEYIQQIRNELSTLIGIVIDNELVGFRGNTGFIDTFCEYVVENSKGSRNKKCTVITTNWDILLDRRIFDILRNRYRREPNPRVNTIDHGTSVVGYGRNRTDQIPPALSVLTRGGTSVSLYKIHGSLNWLKCPSCDRLFVNKNLKVGIPVNGLNDNCRFCESQFHIPNNIEDGYSLQPQIIYPTFLKGLNTSHFTNIWNSVAQSLSETKRIVFIGYSFQQSDFEIRQLLARKLPDDCKIINVGNSPELNEGNEGYENSAQSRYKNFFGRRAYQYYDCGAKEFIENHLQELLAQE